MGAQVAVLDANVLYPARLRDLLVRLAIAGLYRARWSERILDECFHNLFADRPDLPVEHLDRTRRLTIVVVDGTLLALSHPASRPPASLLSRSKAAGPRTRLVS